MSILLDGRPVSGLPSRAAEALFFYLACSQRPVSRETLAELLWAERSQQQALTNLRTILTGLRKELGDFLDIQRETLAIKNSAAIWLDSAEFVQRMKMLDLQIKAFARLDDSSAGELRAALDLYRGDFLTGFSLREGVGFEEWAIIEQERLRRVAHLGLRRLCRHYLETGNYPDGVAAAQKLLVMDPYDEDSLRSLMWLLARNGQRNAALNQYIASRRALMDELGVDPAPETRKLYEHLRSLVFPPPNNLPHHPAPLVGRAADLGGVTDRLSRSDCRLVTILGPGGIGKTRLAIETAWGFTRHRPGQFLDGIFFVEAESVESAPGLAVRIAEITAVSLGGAGPVQDQLVEALHEREMLLVLDDFEHLAGPSSGAVALLAALLKKAPRLKFLVTSRQRLNLYEEEVFDLHGLALPPDDTAWIEQAAAVRLFIQSAERINSRFAPDPAGLGAVARTCRLLDGLPLAIELAAGWARQHTCHQIEAHLLAGLDILNTPLHNVAPGHRSMQAVFEHSWELLTPGEQATFTRLSVFEGEFSRQAAAAVLGTDENGAGWAGALVDKSMLQSRSGDRLAIHPLLRQYARIKLAGDQSIQAATARAHAGYYFAFLRGQGSGEETPQRQAIRLEMDNLRAAWRWACAHGESGLIQEAAATLHSFYSAQSWFLEGIEAFQDAIAAFESQGAAAPLLCELYSRQARMQIHIGQLEPARAALEQARLLLGVVTDPVSRASVTGYLAITHYYAGDYDQAAALAGQSLAESEAAGDIEGVATATNFLGSCHKARGDYDLARRDFEQAARIYAGRGDALGEAMTLNNLGNLAQITGEMAAAQAYYRECIRLFKECDHIHGASTSLANAGKLALHLGQLDEARALLLEGLELKDRINDRRGKAVVLANLGELDLACQDQVAANARLAQALDLAHSSGDTHLTLEILAGMAAAALAQGDKPRAAAILQPILPHPALSREVRERAETLAAAIGSVPQPAAPPSLSELVEQLLNKPETLERSLPTDDSL